MKKCLFAVFLFFIADFSLQAKSTHALSEIIQSSPTAFILYCINPYDCPNCYIGYQLVKRDVEPYFVQKYWLFPGNVDSADVMYFMKLHFNFAPSPSHVFFDDSLYRQYCPGQAAMCIINKGKILWSSTLHDLQFGDYPKIQNDSDRIVLLQQIDVSKYIKNPGDKLCLIHDSVAIVSNSLRNDISAININSDKVIKTFTPVDSLLVERLISMAPVAKSQIDSNLNYLHTPTAIFKKYYRYPLYITNFECDEKNVWVGLGLEMVFAKKDSTGTVNDDIMFYGFLFKFNDSLTKIQKIYALPVPTDKNGNWDKNGLWANLDNFSFKDSSTVYLPITSNQNVLLGKYFLNDINKRIELQQGYKMYFPDEIPKKYNGMNIGYTANVKRGVQDSVFMFDGGVDIYKFYDSHQQINLNPELPKWADKNGVNAIEYYDYLPTKQQAFVILYKQDMTANQTTPRGYYYCFLDKNYNPVESKPLFLANDASFTELPDSSLQVIAKDNGKYTLKIYKAF